MRFKGHIEVQKGILGRETAVGVDTVVNIFKTVVDVFKIRGLYLSAMDQENRSFGLARVFCSGQCEKHVFECRGCASRCSVHPADSFGIMLAFQGYTRIQ